MASVDLDLDEYELRARALQGMEAAYWPKPLTPIAAPPGLSPLSSIRPADKETPIPQLRPALSAPKNVMYDLIASHQETERLANKSAANFDADVTKNMADINRLSAEKEEALEREAEAAKARATWSTLSNVAQYITGAGAITLGFAIGGLPGLCMGLAGGIGITNRVVHDTQLLKAGVEWYTKSNELQRKITNHIEMGAFFLQMGLGLAGGVIAWHTGALAGAQVSGDIIKDKLASILTGAGGVISAGSQVGSGYYQKKLAYLQAEMRDIDTRTTLDHQAMYHDSAQMTKMIELTQTQAEEMKKSIHALEVSQD